MTRIPAAAASAGDWVDYLRMPARPVEAMHAHFARYAFGRHLHDTYSFGVTDSGARAFRCRGASPVSASGMVMALNPGEPHDGHAAVSAGFTYKIVHLGPELVADALADPARRPGGLPLFTEPVLDDPVLAGALRRLHAALAEGSRLTQDEVVDTPYVLSYAAAPPSRPTRASRHASATRSAGSAICSKTATPKR